MERQFCHNNSDGVCVWGGGGGKEVSCMMAKGSHSPTDRMEIDFNIVSTPVDSIHSHTLQHARANLHC